MKNKVFCVLALVLVVLIGLVAVFGGSRQTLHVAGTNSLVVAALAAEKIRLQEAISQGCASQWLRDAFLPEPRSTLDPGALAAGSRRWQALDDLAAQLDSSVVLILGKQSLGTGFMISPELVVTNRHVVEKDGSGPLWITNRRMKQLVKAKLVSASPSSNIMQPDFAVLRLETVISGATTLSIAKDPTRLSPVVAAGYPSAVVHTDAGLQSLLSGDARNAPEAVLTIGEVSVVQPQENGVKLVIHTAEISPGNSGGPLVDQCGRVVGVNTFVRQADQANSRILYSLSAENLRDFLVSKGIAFQSAEESCDRRSAKRS